MRPLPRSGQSLLGVPPPRRQNPYGWPWQRQEPRREAPVDYSRAPPPHKRETPATTNVLVLGDSMADWLGVPRLYPAVPGL